MSSNNEIFLDPEYSNDNPEKVIFRVGFNESGRLGLITSYHIVAGEVIFVGLSLHIPGAWVSKTPLVIKEEVTPQALEVASSALKAAMQQQIQTPGFLKYLLGQIINNPSDNVSMDQGFFGSPSKSPPSLGQNPFNESSGNLKFNFDDFLTEFNIEFDEDKDPETEE